MEWTNENEFVETVASKTCRVKKSSASLVKVWREVPTGYGRPDIAVIEYLPIVYQNRNPSMAPRKPLTTMAAFALSYLSERRWVRQASLASFLQCQHSQFVNVLEELRARQMINLKDHLVKARPKAEIVAIRSLTVYEAKLHHWRQAADQAERHLWFTGDSYVLMPFTREVATGSAKAECIRRGVGFSVFCETAGLQTVVHPAQKGFSNSPLLWSLNEKLWEEYNERRDYCNSNDYRHVSSVSFFSD